ncbi:unnamed protein product [Closterium sp. NIES-54]
MPRAKAVLLPPACPDGKVWNADVQVCVCELMHSAAATPAAATAAAAIAAVAVGTIAAVAAPVSIYPATTCVNPKECKSNNCVNGLCLCRPGLVMLPDGRCASSCDGVECGPNSSCNSACDCICDPDYITLPDGTCTESCSIKTCGAGEECVDFSGDNGESVCRCLDGYVGEPGSCVESCSIKACGAGEECVEGDNGESVCRCLDGYVGEPGSCVGTYYLVCAFLGRSHF